MSTAGLHVPHVTSTSATGQKVSVLHVPASYAVVHTLTTTAVSILAAWGIEDEDLLYATRLSLKELGANAVKHGPRHTDSMMVVSVQLQAAGQHPGRVVVAVQDTGTGCTKFSPKIGGLEEQFRGLAVLGGYGARVEPVASRAGTTVAAWIPLDPDERARVCPCPCWDHLPLIPRCSALVDQDAGTVVLSQIDQLIVVCRACAEAIAETRLQTLLAAERLAAGDPALAPFGRK